MDEELGEKVVYAIRNAQRRLRWRPKKAEIHLHKRIDLGHLGAGTTLDEYETVIRQVLFDLEADIYTFAFNDRAYPTVVGNALGRQWLVMLDMSGTLETSFAVEKPETYFADRRFTRWGKAKELLSGSID